MCCAYSLLARQALSDSNSPPPPILGVVAAAVEGAFLQRCSIRKECSARESRASRHARPCHVCHAVCVHVQNLRDHADEPGLQEEWREVKAIAKKKAAARIESLTGVKVNPNALFDVQVGHRAASCLMSVAEVLVQSQSVV